MNSPKHWRAVWAILLLAVSSFRGLMFPTAVVGDEPSSRPTSAASATVPALELEPSHYGANEDRLQTRSADAQDIELAGTWQMASRDADASIPFGFGKTRALPEMGNWPWHEVSVPGSIRSGLLEAGVIEDPYWNDNAGKSLWTEKLDWWFRKSVVAPNEWAGRRVFLGFDGVDYYSSVWFNGTFLGDHEGMYGGPVVEVTSLVRLGQANEVVVNIHPGGTDEPGKVFKGYIFMKWHYLTDLSPRGIWQGARLVATGPVRLEKPFVQTRLASEQEAVLDHHRGALQSG